MSLHIRIGKVKVSQLRFPEFVLMPNDDTEAARVLEQNIFEAQDDFALDEDEDEQVWIPF